MITHDILLLPSGGYTRRARRRANRRVVVFARWLGKRVPLPAQPSHPERLAYFAAGDRRPAATRRPLREDHWLPGRRAPAGLAAVDAVDENVQSGPDSAVLVALSAAGRPHTLRVFERGRQSLGSAEVRWRPRNWSDLAAAGTANLQ